MNSSLVDMMLMHTGTELQARTTAVLRYETTLFIEDF